MSVPADVLSGIDPQTGLGLTSGINVTISGARVDDDTKSTWNYTLSGGSPMDATQEAVAANISKKSLGTQHSYAPSLFEVAVDTTNGTMTVVLHDSIPVPPSPADKGTLETFSDQSIIDKLVEKLTLVRDSFLPSAGTPFLYQRDGEVFDMRIPAASVADLNPNEFEGIADFLDSEVATDLSIPPENVKNVGSDVVAQDDNIVITSPVEDVISRVQNGEFKVFINVPMSGMLRAGVSTTSSDTDVATVVYEESTHCLVVTPLSKGTTQISYTLTGTGTGGSATDTFQVTVAGQPVVTLTGGSTLSVNQNQAYTEQGAVADGGEVVTVAGDAVDTATPGVYTVTYTATNSFGSGAASRVVTVVDNIAPVITVTGDNPTVLQQFGNFIDPGATSNGGEAVTVSGTVDTAVAATYTLTYSATDAAGNTGTATRSVEVQPDLTPPVITVLGDNPVNHIINTPYTDAGVAVAGGNLTNTDNPVDIAAAASYTVTYTAEDAAGNQSTATRTVTVVAGPVITLNGDNPLNWERYTPFVNPGATADGGETITEDTSNLIVGTVGSYDIVYSATNAGGTSYKVRGVIVADTTPPTINLVGNNPQTMTQGGTYVEAGATADGGEAVTIDSTAVDTAVIGAYSVTYTATDDQGNQATATRTVNVVAGDPNAPQGGSLVGGNPLTIERLTAWADVDPGSIDAMDPLNFATVTATVDSSLLDVDVVGTYNVTYTWTGSTNLTTQLVRSVVVEDTTAPYIALNGDNPINVAQGDTFTDPGAFTDSGEAVTATGTVDTAVVGTYTLTYNATDSSGNAGVAKTRTVNVVEEFTTETSGTDKWRSFNTAAINAGGRIFFDPNQIRQTMINEGHSGVVHAGILNNGSDSTLAGDGFLFYVIVDSSSTTAMFRDSNGNAISGASNEIVTNSRVVVDMYADGAYLAFSTLGSSGDPLTWELHPGSPSYQGGVLESPNTQTPTNTFKFGMRVLNAGSFDLDSITQEVLRVQTGVGRLEWTTQTVGPTPQIYFRFVNAESPEDEHLPLGDTNRTYAATPGSVIWLPEATSSFTIQGRSYDTNTNTSAVRWAVASQAIDSGPWTHIMDFPDDNGTDLSVFSNRTKTLSRTGHFPSAYKLRLYPRDVAGTLVPTGFTKGVDSSYALDILVRYGAPTVTMTGGALMFLNVGDTFTDPGATATDSATVVATSTVDTSTAGEYSVTYTAVHPIGREEGTATRAVYVLDPSNPPPSWPAQTAFDHGLYAGRTSGSNLAYLSVGNMAGGDAGTFGFMSYGNNSGTTWAWSQAIPGSTLNVPTEIYRNGTGTEATSTMYLTGGGITWTTNFSNAAVGTSNPYTLRSGGVSVLTDGDTVQGTHNGRTLTFRFTSTPTTIFNWVLGSDSRFQYAFPSMQVGRYINVGTPTAIFEFGGKAGSFYYKVRYNGTDYAFPFRSLNFPVPQGYQVRLITAESVAYFNGTSGLRDYTNTAIASASSGDLTTIAYYYDGSGITLRFYTM